MQIRFLGMIHHRNYLEVCNIYHTILFILLTSRYGRHPGGPPSLGFSLLGFSGIRQVSVGFCRADFANPQALWVIWKEEISLTSIGIGAEAPVRSGNERWRLCSSVSSTTSICVSTFLPATSLVKFRAAPLWPAWASTCALPLGLAAWLIWWSSWWLCSQSFWWRFSSQSYT